MPLQLPGYRDFQPIHQGRRHAVFRVREEGTGQSRIVKTVLPGTAAAGLLHEHELLRDLDLPGVVKPLQLVEATGVPALVLEDAGPLDLAQHLKQAPLTLEPFLKLALQLAGTVLRLHQRGIIHRDINPSNIVLRPDSGQLTLIDFGTATRAAGLVGASEGTLAYIAPEQTGRMHRGVDHRADLYSLGATFYELLTGVPPFVSNDLVELVHAHLARQPVPPDHLHPAIPRLLSDIVLKLLAKMPEERYQSAEALELDLSEAWRQWKDSGAIAPFPLARHDRARELIISDTLYGREDALAELHEALKRVGMGPSELVLITGEAGSGKSCLVQELRSRVAAGAGFLSGKFDLLSGNVPYAPIVEALGQLLRGLRQEPPAVVLSWRQRLQEALGPHGGILTGVVPELAFLLGEPPPAAPPGTGDFASRFQLSLQALIQLFATQERPLVLFLDDMQWADAGSLELLRGLATASDLRHVLLLGTYRSKEVGPDHLLLRTLGALRDAGVSPRTLEVAALDLGAVTRLCGDTLHQEPARVEPLARLLLRKTAGNPFFLKRLLRFLHQLGLLAFDAERQEWAWDLARIEEVEITENVIELMLLAIRRLPELTQRLLEVASCFRYQVDLWLLAAVAGRSLEETAGALWSALQEGLLIAEEQGPRFARAPAPAPEGSAAQSATYRFVHDRIVQALYSLLSDEEKRHIHLRLGRELLEGVSEAELDERIFEVVDHFDMGLESNRSPEPSERLRLAELYFRAGSKAKTASAFSSALTYLRQGLRLLPQDAWQSRHELTLQFHREAAECAHLTNDPGLAERLIQEALPHVASDLERLSLYEIHVIACTLARRYEEAFQWGLKGLRLLGHEPPLRDAARAFAEEAAAVNALLRGRTHEDLLNAPSTQDPRLRALMRFVSSLMMATWFVDQTLHSFLYIWMLRLSLEHGHSPSSTYAYANYATVLGQLAGDFNAGMSLGEIGVELSRRYGDRSQECRCLLAFASGVSHWRAPYRTSVSLTRRAIAVGLEGNDFLCSSYAVTNLNHFQFCMGVELSRVHEDLESGLLFLRKVGHRDVASVLLIFRQAVRCLQDRTYQRARYDDESFSEKEFLESIRESPLALCEFQVLRVQTSYLLGDLTDALEKARAAAGSFHQVAPFPIGIDYVFYTALTLAAYSPVAPASEKDSVRSQLEAHLHRLDTWAQGCPDNFRQKHLLVSAELARLDGHVPRAMRLYDSAIEAAHQSEFPQDEALANELAGRFYHSLGHRRIAALYLHEAMKGFARRGAKAKATALEEEFPDLVLSEALSWKLPSTREHEDAAGARLDLLSILKAAETLSGEVVLDRLLEKLLTVCIEVAGAQRGALILHEEGSLFVRALGSTSEPVSLERTPCPASPHVPSSLVIRAYDSGDAIILADARHGTFSTDPYVLSHGLKSALAVPIRRQATSVGVLYLENNLATRAFAPDRVRVLQILSSQMAISLENSLLFEKLHVEVEERRRAERAVRFLAESSVILAESLDYETTLTRVAHLAIPVLADGCVVLVREEPRGIRCVAIASTTPAREAVLRELQQRHSPQWDSLLPGVTALRTGQPQLIPEVSEDHLRSVSTDGEHLRLLLSLGLRSFMAVPLLGKHETLGSIGLLSVSPGRRYTHADLALAQELARRASLFIENARLYRQAQQAIRARDEFLSIASHELYTPLTSLQLSLQGLERAASASPELISRASQNARRQIRRLSRLIDELLSVARLQADRLQLHLEEVDLAALTRDVVEHFSEESSRSSSPLLLHADGPVIGLWDKARLEQVITNLLANALKFGNRKPIELFVSSDDDTARLTVEDHGIGIAPDKLPHIFGRFERAVSSREYGGLGLGLYIAHEIVSGLGGSVEVHSTPGVGTRFTVQLPRSGPSTSKASAQDVAGHA